MNPKHLFYILSLLVLASCGTSSNFQKKKFLKLKPLETAKYENESTKPDQEKQHIIFETESAELFVEEEPVNFFESTEEIDEGFENFDDFSVEKTLTEDRKHPKKTKFKHQELMEPLEATHMEEQKRGIIFVSIAAGFYVIGAVTFVLLFNSVLSPLVGGIIIGVCIAALIALGILAIINGKKALKGKKENAWHWVARIFALAGGIISLIYAGGLLGNLIFFLLFF